MYPEYVPLIALATYQKKSGAGNRE
jgi:hypothetical protein